MGYVTRAYFEEDGHSSDHFTDGKNGAIGTMLDLLHYNESGYFTSGLVRVEIVIGVETEDFETGDYPQPMVNAKE